MVRPTTQDELVIFNFVLDIVKMYRQVLVREEHRSFQYILWNSSLDQYIQTFQLNTVTYGLAAAPYIILPINMFQNSSLDQVL